jgi:hypothetical protein
MDEFKIDLIWEFCQSGLRCGCGIRSLEMKYFANYYNGEEMLIYVSLELLITQQLISYYQRKVNICDKQHSSI